MPRTPESEALRIANLKEKNNRPGWGGPPRGKGTGGPKRTAAEALARKQAIPPEVRAQRRLNRAERRETLLDALYAMGTDPKVAPMARVGAIDRYLDRTEGKPAQTLVNVNGGDLDTITPEERSALLGAVRAKLGPTESAGTEPKPTNH